MRPILILQHEELQDPDFLQQCLGDEGLDAVVLRPDQGDRIPGEVRAFAGATVLGSDHSVHDKLSWIVSERVLLQQALAHEVPALAHCFGEQQLALVAGAQVSRNAWPTTPWARSPAHSLRTICWGKSSAGSASGSSPAPTRAGHNAQPPYIRGGQWCVSAWQRQHQAYSAS